MTAEPIRGLANTCDALADFVRNENVLLVRGRTSYLRCGAEAALERILSLSKTVATVEHVGDLLSVDELDVSSIRIQGGGHSKLIAVGGGAILDSAKILAMSLATGRLPSELCSSIPGMSSVPPIFAIPTTAGSGAEATHFAVAYRNRTKCSIGHVLARPVHVALVPEFTFSLSPYQTACTGFDAISQAVESLWAKGATVESRIFAERALGLLSSYEKVLGAPDPESRARMQEGAYWSGCAINISKTTAAHALSYYLTSHYGIPHGHAVAMVFPYVVRHNLRFASIDPFCRAHIPSVPTILPTLSDFCDQNGISFDGLCGKLLSSVDPTRMKNNPVPLAPTMFVGILDKNFRHD